MNVQHIQYVESADIKEIQHDSTKKSFLILTDDVTLVDIQSMKSTILIDQENGLKVAPLPRTWRF